MKKKITVLLVCFIVIATVVPVVGSLKDNTSYSSLPNTATNLKKDPDKKIQNISKNSDVSNRNPETWEVDDDLVQCPGADFVQIQPAIDAAGDGDSIIVYDGTYPENLNVNKQLSLGAAGLNVIINGLGNDDVVDVNADGVSLHGFYILNSSVGKAGVNCTDYNTMTVLMCFLFQNFYGIRIHNSNGNSIIGCLSFNNFADGVNISESVSDTISNSFIFGNAYNGIKIKQATNINIESNGIHNNTFEGINISSSGLVASPIIISGNRIVDNNGNGIVLQNSEYVEMSGNSAISNNSKNGVLLLHSNWSDIRNTLRIYHNGVGGSSLEERSGVHLLSSDNNTIRNNICDYNLGFNIGLRQGSDNNTVEGNDCGFSGDDGISIRYGSDDNKIQFQNKVYNSTDEGIHLRDEIGDGGSARNTILGNVVWNNSLGGIYCEAGVGRNNSIEQNRVYHNGFDSGSWLDGISLMGSQYTIISLNFVYDNHQHGISLYQNANHNIISENYVYNTVAGNQQNGIHLDSSHQNIISDCSIYNNSLHGIFIRNSNSNLIYNNYFNNTNNAEDNGNNRWNISKTPGLNIIGGVFIGGNFWSNYTGFDNDGDGLGDTNYTIPGGTNTDHHPLVRANQPPNKPAKPSGIVSGKINTLYTYKTSAIDPNGDQVWYQWDWGDGSQSNWLGPSNSGATISTTHKWTVKGSYSIKVKAKDTYGTESPWSDPLSIKMPYSYNYPITQFWEKLLERFPHAFPILRHFLRY
ncbi:MAG TPA: NosD domain-containing protein [Candidatus Thermoplasmatota archaeon]|nr:NosD domain-containing protein [Candidatus Thermoplasmatota archaeon]